MFKALGRSCLFAVGYVLVLIFVSSCGIDTIAYLNSKVTPKSDNASSFVFLAPTDTEASYLGVFLFYRIYASELSAQSDLENLNNKQSITNAVPGSSVESYLLAPKGLNYKRLAVDFGAPIPTLEKSLLEEEALVSIDFPSSTGVEPTITITSGVPAVTTVYKIWRNITGSNEELSFRDRPQSGQDDYTTSSLIPNPTEYYIQFFAATYGIDLSDLSELYGDAVDLGRITVYF